ncbi:MAG: adenylosuccinate lyase [Chloroflexota bacterium]|nr:adenylosuccinate lyase [Chloroflexota bacterium]
MTQTFTHATHLSPFTWRYGSDAMRQLWSEEHKRRLWRRIWVALAAAQAEVGLVTPEQVEDLRAHEDAIDIERAHTIEAEIKHDLMAEIKTYAEQCPVGGGIIHLGATSMDIEDNADALRLRDGLSLLIKRLRTLLLTLCERIETEADHVCMAWTHLQPAEPTTVGYRLALYAQDLAADYNALLSLRDEMRGKGLKGAVGTAASYAELLAGTAMTPPALEAQVMRALDLRAYTIATQTYPRRQDWTVLTALSGLGMSIYKLAFDIRVLQMPPIGEWAEPFGATQVGSSAMPFKRNPINAENLDSLARYLAALPNVAWGNAADNLLERTLDDSANRRIILPQAFLTADELLLRAVRLVDGLRIDGEAVKRTLDRYGVFAATERLLMASVKAGGDRQHLHEVIRKHSLAAWAAVQRGEPNPLAHSLAHDSTLIHLLSPDTIHALLDASQYIGDAAVRARGLIDDIRSSLNLYADLPHTSG